MFCGLVVGRQYQNMFIKNRISSFSRGTDTSPQTSRFRRSKIKFNFSDSGYVRVSSREYRGWLRQNIRAAKKTNLKKRKPLQKAGCYWSHTFSHLIKLGSDLTEVFETKKIYFSFRVHFFSVV